MSLWAAREPTTKWRAEPQTDKRGKRARNMLVLSHWGRETQDKLVLWTRLLWFTNVARKLPLHAGSTGEWEGATAGTALGMRDQKILPHGWGRRGSPSDGLRASDEPGCDVAWLRKRRQQRNVVSGVRKREVAFSAVVPVAAKGLGLGWTGIEMRPPL
ncbi:hypothetical protein NDU88_004930 [Pleurodeles waltl]|uniref:Uncharacterized protein n=1 Tax=Pleurodeles waltl TaxID=8319 RepID=A0AAV7RJI4_PLEWA|nr:hypothetical protein NDU88_004930 [Pleurodeles waltl]